MAFNSINESPFTLMTINMFPYRWIGGIPVDPVLTPETAQETLPVIYPECEFCGGKTKGDMFDIGSQGKMWNICMLPRCWAAAKLQKDRIYNGLVDCQQTREDVLRWIDSKNVKVR